MWGAVASGFLLGGSLIVAIGAQNAFVIRQGALGRHVFWVCLFCSASDVLLIWTGVLGLSSLIGILPVLVPVMTYGGAAFLFVYALLALRRALRPSGLAGEEGDSADLLTVLGTCAAFTFLNPHVYLDMVVLIGSVANAQPAGEQMFFAAGASLTSLLWFFLLGYGARAMRHQLRRPNVWRILDLLIAVIMFVLAARLVMG